MTLAVAAPSLAASSPSAAVSPRLVRWMGLCLALWGVGVQTVEALASAGLAGTVICALVEWWPRRSVASARAHVLRWLPLYAWVLWALVAPLAGGHLPTGAGVGRLSDWLALPAGVRALELVPSATRRRIGIWIAATFALSIAVAEFQHLGVWPKPEAFKALSWTKLPIHRVYEEIPGSPGRFMAGGLLWHRLKFAHIGGLLVVHLAIAAAFVRGRMRALLVTLALAGFIATLVFAYARAASATLAVVLLVLMVVAAPRRLRLASVGAAALAAVLLVSSVALYAPLRTRFLGVFHSGSNGDRSQLLMSGLVAFESSPFVGIGLGQFRPSKFPLFKTPRHILENPGKAHNQFVSFAAETGAVGSLLFVLLLGWIGHEMRGSRRRLAGWGCLLFFTGLAFAHDPLFQAPFSMALVFSLAWAWADAPEERAARETIEQGSTSTS